MEPNNYTNNNPEVPQPPPDLQRVDNPLEVMQPGEEVVCVIKRHPIGLMGIYFVAAVIVIIAVAVAALLPTYLPDATSQTKLGIILGALLVAAGTLLYVYAATIIYTANRWIVTTDSITQVSRTGLFSTQSSQLSMENLEDITVDQEGIIQSLAGYGTLRAETAGERSKFFFAFCPQANDCARKILNAREMFIRNKH